MSALYCMGVQKIQINLGPVSQVCKSMKKDILFCLFANYAIIVESGVILVFHELSVDFLRNESCVWMRKIHVLKCAVLLRHFLFCFSEY